MLAPDSAIPLHYGLPACADAGPAEYYKLPRGARICGIARGRGELGDTLVLRASPAATGSVRRLVAVREEPADAVPPEGALRQPFAKEGREAPGGIEIWVRRRTVNVRLVVSMDVWLVVSVGPEPEPVDAEVADD